MTDTEQIRALITGWAEAVHRGDLPGVLVDHAEDIVMFDVPPPYEGVRGLAGYRATWPPFFEWQARGAAFEIVDLDITAGGDVAYAHALLRCGLPHARGEPREPAAAHDRSAQAGWSVGRRARAPLVPVRRLRRPAAPHPVSDERRRGALGGRPMRLPAPPGLIASGGSGCS